MKNSFNNFPRPRVVIMGAGATRAAFSDNDEIPPPLDRDFFDIASQINGRATPTLARKVLKDVWEIYGHVHGIGLEQYYRDIETRETIQEIAKPPHQPKKWDVRRKNLEELIRRVLLHTTCNHLTDNFVALKSTLHESLLTQLMPGDSVITFNYDLVIEESFGQKPLWNPSDGYGIKVHGKSHPWAKNWFKDHGFDTTRGLENSKLVLLKLHGSLNWDPRTTNGISLKYKPYWVRSQAGKTVPSYVELIPPSWNKNIENWPYKVLWRTARNHLENAKSLIFVGYSMPDTDVLAQALFAEVASSRNASGRSFSELHLAERNEAVRRKLVELFNPALGPKGKIFEYDDFEHFCRRQLGFKRIDETMKQNRHIQRQARIKTCEQ